jgi:hypothetical protein
VPCEASADRLRELAVPEHIVHHLTVMAELHVLGRYDRMTDDVFKLTGKAPINMNEFVKLHAAEVTKSEAAA